MADGVQVTVKSQTWYTPQVQAAVAAGSKKASLAGGQAILADANEHVPFETGTLHDSGKVDQTASRGTTTAIISYNTPYARRLHENPQYHFENGREGKWLEHALARARGYVVAVMVGGFRGVFR